MGNKQSVLKRSSGKKTSIFPLSKVESFLPTDLPANYRMRPLQLDDFSKGYVTILSQLTSMGNVSQALFEERFKAFTQMKPTSYFTVVIEDLDSSMVVASGTLVLEWKFIHECGSRGRIEDIVVDSAHRGKRLGVKINDCLVKLAKSLGVYKLSLECKDALIPFYQQFGFHKDEGNNFLVQRFD